MFAILNSAIYKHQLFGSDERGDVWRIWFDDFQGGPMMERIDMRCLDYEPVVRLLRAMGDLYR